MVSAVGQQQYAFRQPDAAWAPATPAPSLGYDQYQGGGPSVAAGGPSDGGILSVLANTISKWLEKLLRFFRGPGAAQAVPPGSTGVPPAPGVAPSAPVPGIPAIWQGPPGQLEGFDFNKLNDLNHRTVKYAFARCVSGISLASVRDHASGEALLRSLVPRFQSAGMQVLDVSRDKILVVTEVGPEWVDVIRGAGSGSPGWWWGSEGKPAAGVVAPPYVPPNPGHPAPLPALGPAPVPVPPPPGRLPPGALPSLQTVPVLPEYGNVPINRSNDAAAVLSAAQAVKARHPDWFMVDDRGVCLQIMTEVIGILRANGYDAHRVVNHPSKPVGDPWRYGSDALVLNGQVWDVYQGIGDPNMSRPQALNVGVYEPGRARE